jgi:hypothetical protein
VGEGPEFLPTVGVLKIEFIGAVHRPDQSWGSRARALIWIKRGVGRLRAGPGAGPDFS